MSFSHNFNADNVIIRSAIVGLVNELNNRVHFYNVWSDDNKKLVRVPFYYAMSGDEKFLQDYFSNWNDCAPDFIEGNTDPIPRGVISLTGVSVISTNLTSRYVRGNYTKEEDGEIKQFNSYINSIPLQLNFSAEILVDTYLDSLKIIESAMSVLYKTLVFNIQYNGFVVPTQVGFPEAFANTKQFEYTYGNAERIKVTFEIELQTYLPITDPNQEFFAGNRIENFNLNIDTSVSNVENKTPADVDKVINTTEYRIVPKQYANVPPSKPIYTNAVLKASDWNNLTQTIHVAGVTLYNNITISVSTDRNDFLVFGTSNVSATQQGPGTITFKCTSVPTEDIVLNIKIEN